MSSSDLHKKKRRKNLVLLALIFAWCALIWAITMVKLARAEETPELPHPLSPVACTMEAKECPDGSFVSRSGPDCEFSPCPGAVLEDMPGPEDETGDTEGASEGAAGSLPEALPVAVPRGRSDVSIDELFAEVEAEESLDGEVAGEDFVGDQGKFIESRKAHLQETVAAEEKMMTDGAEHRKFIESQPASWWENWQDKIDPEK